MLHTTPACLVLFQSTTVPILVENFEFFNVNFCINNYRDISRGHSKGSMEPPFLTDPLKYHLISIGQYISDAITYHKTLYNKTLSLSLLFTTISL